MILERFIAARFFSFLVVLFFGLTGLYLLIEAFEKLPDFLDAGVSFFTTAVYFCLISLNIIFELSPLIILLAGLMTLVTMGKSRELMALRSIGISTRRISMPILAGAMILAVVFTTMKIFLIPEANKAANLILKMETGVSSKDRGTVAEGGRLYYRGKDSILTGQILIPDGSMLADVEWMFFSPSYKVSMIIACAQARYVDNRWEFTRGVKRQDEKSSFFDRLSVDIDLTPQDLLAIETPVEEASASQLLKAILRLRSLGLPYHKQETTLLSQLLYSFLGVSLLFACLPLVFFRVEGGAAVGLVLGTGIGFGVWALWNMAVSMGKTGAILPFIATMGPHIFLISAGIWARKRFSF
ncbi:MAG: hypothetical protein DSZ23_05555 [Thermodesulfatator sp.]|nr:MAG: hypothetical protein DSZ23_05555 [Thermodesulfatator sp.]